MSYSDPRTVCAPWITEEELCCAGDSSVTDCATDEQVELVYPWSDADIILAASNILFARTCFRYSGLCEVTVWPCSSCACSCHPCACGTWSKLDLPSNLPIQSIDEVRIGGVVIDPAAYRLDRSQWLVRIDGDRWPSCNSFGLPNTTAEEIQVDMTVGRAVPIELKMAAADLSCELKKACNNSEECALPPHVRSIARRGVEIQIDDISSLFKDGLFGIPSVDMAVKIHGRCGHQGSIFDPAARNNFRGYGIS